MRWMWMGALVGLAACSDASHPEELNGNEVITTVELSFTPEGGGEALIARWADPEDDGSPVIDEVVLGAGLQYTLSVRFINELSSPSEDITTEVEAEGDQHQVFFTGEAVDLGLVEMSYLDEDDNGNPVGLEDQVVAGSAGEGSFVVTLRHMPPQGDVEVKTAGLAAVAASEGVESLPGDTDAQVSFDLTVQ